MVTATKFLSLLLAGSALLCLRLRGVGGAAPAPAPAPSEEELSPVLRHLGINRRPLVLGGGVTDGPQVRVDGCRQ